MWQVNGSGQEESWEPQNMVSTDTAQYAGGLPGLQYSWNVLVNKERLNSLKKERVGKSIKKPLKLLKKKKKKKKMKKKRLNLQFLENDTQIKTGQEICSKTSPVNVF